MSEGKRYLDKVTGQLKERIGEVRESILQGQKDIEGMHEYYWENYTEMDQYGYEDFDNQQALLHQGQCKPGAAGVSSQAGENAGFSFFRKSRLSL